MTITLRILLITLSLAFGCSEANAQLVEIGTTTTSFIGTIPASPTASTAFSISVQSGPCESLGADPSSATATQTSADEYIIHIPGDVFDACPSPPTNRRYWVPLSLPQGSYRLRLEIVRPNTERVFVATRLVSVISQGTGGSTSVVTVPSLSDSMLALLLAAVAVVGLLFARGVR